MNRFTETGTIAALSLALGAGLFHGYTTLMTETQKQPEVSPFIQDADNQTAYVTVDNLQSTIRALIDNAQSRWYEQLEKRSQAQKLIQSQLSDLQQTFDYLSDELGQQGHSIAALEYALESTPLTNPTSISTDIKPASELRLGEHIDQNLEEAAFESEQTLAARAQTQSLMDKLPGVILNDFRCGKGVCRAAFTRVDGDKPNLETLWGEPPFVNQIIEVPQDDGGTILYFTERDVSMDDIRDKLSLSSLGT
jgi:hypothetical protein